MFRSAGTGDDIFCGFPCGLARCGRTSANGPSFRHVNLGQQELLFDVATFLEQVIVSYEPIFQAEYKSRAMRVNGKNWHAPRERFSTSLTQSTNVSKNAYTQRTAREAATKEVKAKEAEMKAEKEAERQRRIKIIKDRREKKEERERWQKMEEKMHRKVVDRRKRREKRNKLLKS